MKRLAFFLVVVFILFHQGVAAQMQTVYFDDTDPNLLIVGNEAFYEVGFRKANGSIAYILDKTTGQNVTLGSRYECLWGAVFPQAASDYVGGCSYHAAGSNRFAYSWLPATSTLTFTFTPDVAASQQVSAQVEVAFSDDRWFDMQLAVQNNWGHRLDYLLFPSDLVFAEGDIEEVLLPVLPGVMLESAFFQQSRTYTMNYPGYPGTFADYVSLSSRKGRLAMYSLYEANPVRPLVMGFIDDDAYITGTTFYYHTFGAGVANGRSWTTPTVRFRIGQSHLDTIRAYRQENGLAQWTSISDKLGSLYAQVSRSPLFKADAQQLGIPFAQYPTLLAQVPTPGILHPVAFQPDGHDENYPDFLPPDSAWGTTADFSTMVQQAQAQGFLVMPYTNPTWWDDESPTLQNLPPHLTIQDLAVLDDANEPVYERYGLQQQHGGYVMSPYAPFVQQRLQQLVSMLTVDVPSDLLFEDQIGARPWLFDNNPASPHPMAYIEGWLAHTQRQRHALLMTELGFDRLAETEVGFHGGVLLPKRFGYTDGWWGDDNWHPYPLAPLMLRDKVLFYQHDLAYETFTTDKETLLWNVAFGHMLSYDLVQSTYGGGVHSEWLDLVSIFQGQVLSRYAHEAMIGYEREAGKITRTLFENYEVVANWHETASVTVKGHEVAPLGMLVTSEAGDMTAGVFRGYNGRLLSNGDHYLVEERHSDQIIVYQPIGADTAITVELLSTWKPNDWVAVQAVAANGEVLSQTWVRATPQGVPFVFKRSADGQTVMHYALSKKNVQQLFLPLSLKQ